MNLLESLLLNSPEKAVFLRKSWLNPRRDPHVFDKPFLTYPALLLLVLIPWLVEIIVAMSHSIWNMDQLTVNSRNFNIAELSFFLFRRSYFIYLSN